MKVLHVVAGDLDKGAARGALWLHQGLLSVGVESHLVFTGGDKESDVKNLIGLSTWVSSFARRVRLRLWRISLKFFYPKSDGDAFSSGWGEHDLSKLARAYKADVLHLHWINQFSFDYASISRVDCKVIWTLRDMWPFTGGCHYSLGCDLFTAACGRCPKLGSVTENDLSRYIYTRKERNRPNNVHYVAISEWLGLQAKKSQLIGPNELTVIDNSVDTDQFFFEVSKTVEKFAGNKKVVLFGGINLNAPYKGLKYIISAIKNLDPDEYCVISFGRINPRSLESISQFDSMHFGPLNDNRLIRQLYSSADVYLFPSIFEAFGKTIVEAQLCGTPVVVFDNSGPGEIVIHKRTGYVAKAFCIDDLIEGILFLCTDFAISKLDQQEIRSKYSIRTGALKYKEVYSKL